METTGEQNFATPPPTGLFLSPLPRSAIDATPASDRNQQHSSSFRPFYRESHDLQLYEEGDVEVGSPLLSVHVINSNHHDGDFHGETLSDIVDPDTSGQGYSPWFIMLTAMLVWYLVDSIYILVETAFF